MDASCLNARQELLSENHSKVTTAQLKTLHDKYNILRAYKLTAPTRSQAIFDHPERKSPLYVRHMEYGLRLSLHPFIDHVCSALGVSPMQLKSNAIAAIVGYVVICHWLGVPPSLSVLGCLISVKSHQREAHYHFQAVGRFKLVLNLPDSNKDWKEKFVWVEGADLELDCASWPEVIKEVLAQKELSPDEKDALERVKSFANSRKMEHLFDQSVLRVARVSVVKPTAGDEERANRLILSLGDRAEGMSAMLPDPQEGLSTRPTKRPSQDLVPTEATVAQPQSVPAVIQAEGSMPPIVQVEKRKRLRKVSIQGPRRAVEASEVEIVHLDGGLTEQEEAVAVRPTATEAEVPVGGVSGTVESVRRQGKEPPVEGEPELRIWTGRFLIVSTRSTRQHGTS